MHRVLAYIDDHLSESLELKVLSQAANFSPFHFHRLFAAWMGETLGSYLRRRRVQVAAMRLASQPRAAVLNVALSVGFGSGEAFSRAFKGHFGCSPTAWRKREYARRDMNSNHGQVNSKYGQVSTASPAQDDVSHYESKETFMSVAVINRKPATIAYLRHIGPYGEAIAKFWQEVYVPWAVSSRLGPDHARYGISYDDPGITPPEQCRYDACAEVAPDFVATGGALKATVPGGKYAVLRFKGTVEEAGEAWTAILRDWLPTSGLQLDDRPCFEYYPKGADCDAATGAFECEICIPVAPL
jgi:AraC family transcriptional regulator